MTTMKTKEELQKITVEVPKSLLSAAQKETGTGITQTVTAGLEKLKATRAYKKLLALEGSINLKIDLDQLREDRF